MVMVNVIESIGMVREEVDFVTALETGTIRSYHEKHDSTLHICNAIKGCGHLYSLDIEQKSIDIANDICKDVDNVTWVLGDSLQTIPYLCESLSKESGSKDIFDFVLLDSVNVSSHILREFKLILPYMKNNSIIVVDDSGINLDGKSINMIEPRAMKGIGIWEHLVEYNYPFEIKQINDRTSNIIFRVTESLKQTI